MRVVEGGVEAGPAEPVDELPEPQPLPNDSMPEEGSESLLPEGPAPLPQGAGETRSTDGSASILRGRR